MHDLGRKTVLRQRFLYLLPEHDRAMLSAGAADGDRQIALAFGNVMRNQIGEQSFDATEKFASLRKRADVLLDFGIFASVAAQARNKVGIGKEAYIENQVRVRRNAIFVAKADDGNEHRTLIGILKALGDEVPQLVNVELRGVDDHVRKFADGLHKRAFVAQAFANGKSFSQRMRAARLAIAAEECVISCIDEYQ